MDSCKDTGIPQPMAAVKSASKNVNVSFMRTLTAWSRVIVDALLWQVLVVAGEVQASRVRDQPGIRVERALEIGKVA